MEPFDSVAKAASGMARMMWRETHDQRDPGVTEAEVYLELVAQCVRALRAEKPPYVMRIQ
ncbi:hypothetical protein EYF88_15260 [Paracoccus sediminis]|uniref:Uncharacterized protein n=1 Tax=Paracoccus sediminis TaxID=1214787 RepID=A0A238XXF7_9RHOB|nr:hypothetical protein [Paracoccus sediminis]TBN47560.1 hypothetical protein EYF88_15260 [Paracoccus sediminis]SNR63034.1 hypothetical protein SAMN06265378_1132 [Paracoccus sediminis]